MQIRCADEKRGVKKGIPSTVVELQSMKSKVDGKERYLPLTVELRVRQDGGHDGCSMSGRVAVHGPDDLHAHQALTTCTRHAGHSVTARLVHTCKSQQWLGAQQGVRAQEAALSSHKQLQRCQQRVSDG